MKQKMMHGLPWDPKPLSFAAFRCVWRRYESRVWGDPLVPVLCSISKDCSSCIVVSVYMPRYQQCFDLVKSRTGSSGGIQTCLSKIASSGIWKEVWAKKECANRPLAIDWQKSTDTKPLLNLFNAFQGPPTNSRKQQETTSQEILQRVRYYPSDWKLK